MTIPRPAGRELGHVPISDKIVHRLLSTIRPSPENDRLYRPIDTTDPDFLALVGQIRSNAITDPLIITWDGYICSGHRRYAAARHLGIDTVPCRTAEIGHDDARFLPFLRACNQQRVKSLDEIMREEIVSADPNEAHHSLREYRRQRAHVTATGGITLGAVKQRARISAAKRPFLGAILRILDEYEDSWPLSVRQVHYYLLNDPPLKHASKPDSTYCNDQVSYKAADELITRARLTGEINFDAIHDPTRPVTTWPVHREPGAFIRAELDGFLKNYWRDLLQSQPNHIEIIGEKNTVGGAIEPVASQYTIPYTIGRGYSSLPPRNDMLRRFKASGKEQLILLTLTDFDPEGEDIGRSFAQSMRDDFGVDTIRPIKVTLTGEQVKSLRLPPMMKAKEESSRRDKFVEQHGENVFELEAIPPATLQQFLREAIDSILDLDAYNAEVEQEKQDAVYLDGARRRAHAAMGNIGA